jgi:Arc/MetJ family transcription regulator
VAKTLIDVNEEYLAAAQQVLHTATKKDTVNAALREVTALAARRRTCAGWPPVACPTLKMKT